MKMKALVGLALCISSIAAATARGSTPLTTTRVASGLALPLYVTAPPGDNNRLFILEQRSGTVGRVRILNLPANTLNATPYLSITPVATGNEQGLLGLAFHPHFMDAGNGYFYVDYTRPPQAGISAGSTMIVRYRATFGDPNSLTADPASATVLLEIPQPDANHNGGWIAFGPDGYLYIAMGDGGCGNDSNCTNPPTVNPPGHTAGTGNAQDITSNLLGKLLRIDVDGPDNIPGNSDDVDPNNGNQYRIPPTNPFVGVTGDDEIWDYGLRNPWRDSFDRLTGDLWIADVGQDVREEINFEPAGSPGGVNYGWRCMEGTRCTGLTGCTCNAANLTLPIRTYDHSPTLCSITGGYVYRGPRIWDLRGTYFFADYCGGNIWTFRYNGTVTNFQERTTELDPPGTLAINNPTSFGEDAAGEMYIVDQSGGEVYKIVPNGPVVGDLNGDGSINNFDIDPFVLLLTNPSAYAQAFPNINGNVVGDINMDGSVNNFDIDAFVALLTTP